MAVGSSAYPTVKKHQISVMLLHLNQHSTVTIRMEGPSLILELKSVEMGRLHKPRQRVLVCQLLACFERISRPHLNTKERQHVQLNQYIFFFVTPKSTSGA